jgi:Ca-activated chloride channel family protein
MVEFARPFFLLLIPAVPLLVWLWLHRRIGAIRFSSTRLLKGLPLGRSRWVRWGGAIARGAALLLLVLALAGLRWPDRRTRIPTQGIALQLIADVSGSMAEPDFAWEGSPITRLEAVKKVFHLFIEGGEGPHHITLEGRPNDLVGLVTFATWPETACPLTLSHSVLLEMLDAEKPRSLPDEARTNIGDALAWGLYRLERTPALRKIVVLLTDGEHNVPPPALTPRQAAQLAANQHIVVYTIDAGGVGLEGGAPNPQRISAEEGLRAIAEITGGQYLRASDTSSLLAACRVIDQLERHEIHSFIYRRYHDAYPWAGLAALILWTGIFALEKTWWNRLP